MAELRARLVDRKLAEHPPSNFIAGRPNAALLFWFFGDFRCGVSLFVLFVLYIKIKIGSIRVYTFCLREFPMQNAVKVNIFTTYPKSTNGLIQLIKMDKFIGQKRVHYFTRSLL